MPHGPHRNRRKHLEDVWEAINARDFAALADLLHPEGEFRSAIAVAEGEVYYGIDGLRRWAENVDATWQALHSEIVEFHDLGEERTLLITRITGKAKLSGVPLDVLTGQMITWRDGKPWRNETFSDRCKALEAAGLSE